MTDYVPAIIGLVGVGLGGSIQVIATAVKTKSEAAFTTRQNAASFRYAVHSYLHFIEAAKDSRNGGKVNAAYGGGEASRRYLAAREAGYTFVGSCRDRRMYDLGQTCLDELEKYAHGHRNLHRWDGEKKFPGRDAVDRVMNALDSMVAPGRSR